MRYLAPLVLDTVDGLPRGRYRHAPTPLNEYLGVRGGAFNPIRYAVPPCSRDRHHADTREIAAILQGRGRTDDIADGLLRVREHTDDTARFLRRLTIQNAIPGHLRGPGHTDDTARLLQRLLNTNDTAGLLRRRGQAEDLARPMLRNGHADNIANILRDRGRSFDLIDRLRDKLANRRQDHSHDHSCSQNCRCLNPADVSRVARAPRPLSWDVQDILKEIYAKPYNLDNRKHCGYNRNCLGCQHKKKSCGCCDSDSNAEKEYAFKTKDVTLRGKSYKIRKGFLTDLSKFESELIKFVEKKSEEELPDSVIQMLVDFINEESCESNSAVDLVGLNILASNLGYKSAVEYSLEKLKKIETDSLIMADELTRICGTITMSGKVDVGLETWLKKFIRNHCAWPMLEASRKFQILVRNHPEVYTRLETIMGWRENENVLGLMIM
jgi:hypothetical protein